MPIDMEKLKQFTELDLLRQKTEQDVKVLKEKCLELNAELLTQFEADGVPNVKIKTKFYPLCPDTELRSFLDSLMNSARLGVERGQGIPVEVCDLLMVRAAHFLAFDDSLRTVYIGKDTYAIREKDITQEQAVAALKRAKLGKFVRPDYSVMTLSAWVRERKEAKLPMPKSFKGIIKVDERFKLVTKKGE